MNPINYSQFDNLTFEDFRRMATDTSLSSHEKVGFPDSYRAGKEECIFRDILGKLPQLGQDRQVVLDIGPGCSGLALRLIEHCGERKHTLVLVDSAEMLAHLPEREHVRKYAALYPNCPQLFAEFEGRVHAILVYSVLQYIFAEGNVFDFLDRSLGLLAPGGAMLLGDIPNVSKRKRFFSSAAGVACHRQFTGRDETPAVVFNHIEAAKIDDSVVLALLMRCRSAGYDAYIVPQGLELPIANRREDMLIVRP
ncbi:MAG TPA: hypothetical protein VH592_13160 [Gemmataceae bacterium]|jgi:hypothetical protein